MTKDALNVHISQLSMNAIAHSAAGGEERRLRGLPYVVEGLLAALLELVNPTLEEGRRQLPAYRVRKYGNCRI